MEFVEGDTLSKIIERGPIPVERALLYAVQIVDALAAAHAKGFIHRDLKPGNVILTNNGVKVLDFGLAKLNVAKGVSVSASSDVATMTQAITGEGRIVGTLYYMSPEQAEAKETDEGSDIFSFGAVFYEMITGRRAFEGDSQASVVASIRKDQPPPMSERQPAVPRAIARVVRKCLEKKPDDRWQSAWDLKPTLELIDLDAPASSSSAAGIPTQAPSRRRRLWPAVTAAAILILAGAAYEFWPRSQTRERVTRFEVPLPEGVQIDPVYFSVQVSPDGSKLAFTTIGPEGGIWIRDLESVQVRLLPATANATAPFWAPDSKAIGFGQDSRLMRVDVAGGQPQGICTADVGFGYWTANGDIVFGDLGAGPLQRVPQAGGGPVPATELAPGESLHSLPSFLPNGRDFLYLIQGPARDLRRIVGHKA
jgi:hypothetical protein